MGKFERGGVGMYGRVLPCMLRIFDQVAFVVVVADKVPTNCSQLALCFCNLRKRAVASSHLNSIRLDGEGDRQSLVLASLLFETASAHSASHHVAEKQK